MTSPMNTVAIMKRVNAILQACRDDPRIRQRVADETSKWIRSKDKQVANDFMSFLHRLELKFNIKEIQDEAKSVQVNGIDEPTPPTKREGAKPARPVTGSPGRRGRRSTP